MIFLTAQQSSASSHAGERSNKLFSQTAPPPLDPNSPPVAPPQKESKEDERAKKPVHDAFIEAISPETNDLATAISIATDVPTDPDAISPAKNPWDDIINKTTAADAHVQQTWTSLKGLGLPGDDPWYLVHDAPANLPDDDGARKAKGTLLAVQPFLHGSDQRNVGAAIAAISLTIEDKDTGHFGAISAGLKPYLSKDGQNAVDTLLKLGLAEKDPLGLINFVQSAFKGKLAIGDVLNSMTKVAGANAVLAAISPFLPRDSQKAVSTLMAVLKDGPQGLMTLAAFLPPDAQKAAAVLGPLLSGNIEGMLFGALQKYLPPELQSALTALMNMGGIQGILGLPLPKLNGIWRKDPSDKPKDEEQKAPVMGLAPLAARVSDMHVCPAFDGPKPHVGGPILPSGAKTVLIGGLPAARMGDKATCAGPPDTIVTGELTVFIDGPPAARLGDSTLHGGAIIQGCPTVVIGKPSTNPGALLVEQLILEGKLVIEGDTDYQNLVRRDLYKIANTSTGRNTLSTIGNSGYPVTIKNWPPGEPGNGCYPPPGGGAYPAGLQITPEGKLLEGTGRGGSSEVLYNPSEANRPPGSPSDAGLHHELAHAAHNATGTNNLGAPGYPQPGFGNGEEFNTTMNEDNAYRKERGLPLRKNHASLP